MTYNLSSLPQVSFPSRGAIGNSDVIAPLPPFYAIILITCEVFMRKQPNTDYLKFVLENQALAHYLNNHFYQLLKQGKTVDEIAHHIKKTIMLEK
jgi:hypothetical protein